MSFPNTAVPCLSGHKDTVKNQMRVAIVGAGIVGLAHAWSAAERGCRVTVFDRSSRASGASIRNFGMVWPIGQPAGECYEAAQISRVRWLSAADRAGIWVNPCGSIHLAHRDDEWTVLQQFAAQADSLGVECELLTPQQIQLRTPAANPDGLLGGLFSPTELCVNPREATRTLPAFLREQLAVQFQFDTHIRQIETSGEQITVITSNGHSDEFDRVIVCCGAELQVLFPEVLQRAGLRLCKLQMMSIRGYETHWNLGPHLASGLTLRHYHNFDVCDGLPQLRQRIAEETPELDLFGIHVMASQNNHGEIIIGDSHEYDAGIEPFDKSLIDSLMLRELKKILRLPDWTIAEHWHGIYAKYSSGPVFEISPLPGVHIVTGTGGAGMTMSFGLAEQKWKKWNC